MFVEKSFLVIHFKQNTAQGNVGLLGRMSTIKGKRLPNFPVERWGH